MSRGPGRTQRGVLNAVAAEGPVSVEDVAEYLSVDGSSPSSLTTSERESIRRAMRRLVEAGRLERADLSDGRLRVITPDLARRVESLAARVDELGLGRALSEMFPPCAEDWLRTGEAE